MPLTHEQAVEFGRRGGGAARAVARRRHYNAVLTVRVPKGLKEWYDRRAIEEGVSTGTMIRQILQGNRKVMSGKLTDNR